MDAKRILTCAALLAGLLFLNGGLVAAVQSDIVGYTTMTMEAGKWYMIGTPFSELADVSEDEIFVNDVFKNKGFSNGDVLYRLNDQGAFVPRWWQETDTNAGWSTSQRRWSPDMTPVRLGEAFYIQKAVSSGSVTFAGKVETKEVSFGAANGQAWDMIVPHWPKAQCINEFAWTNLSKGDTLYRLDDSGKLIPRFWYDDGGNIGWSTSQRRWNPDEKPLDIGEALYINKASTLTGTLSN